MFNITWWNQMNGSLAEQPHDFGDEMWWVEIGLR